MPDLDPTHLGLGLATLASLAGNAGQWLKSRGEKAAKEAEAKAAEAKTASAAYTDARTDLGDCRQQLDEMRSSILIVSNGLHAERAERKALERACSERDLKAATERERDRKQLEAMRVEMDGLRRSITGDAR